MNNTKKELNLLNTLWMNTVIASQSPVYAVALYTGIETRAKLNGRRLPAKFGKFDKALNNATKGLFVFQVVLTFALVIRAGWANSGKVINHFIIVLILLNCILPISLRTILDATKLYSST
jgi:magnesium-transporting ATPase (P-type)